MTAASKQKLLKLALIVFGITCMALYPLGLVWPSGWIWHAGEGQYYFQMIAGIYIVLGGFLVVASRNPAEHRSLIWFTIISSIVHAGIMAVQAMGDHHERGHLVGDVPALILMAAVLWWLMPPKD